MPMNLRRGTEGALLRVGANCRERIRDDGNEEVEQPVVQHNDAHNEENAGDEKLGVHHLVHQGRPLENASASDERCCHE